MIYRDARGSVLGRGLAFAMLLAVCLAVMAGCGGPKEEPYHGTVSLKRFPQKKNIDRSPGATK